MARSLKIRCFVLALTLSMGLAGCGGSSAVATPQPGGAAIPTVSEAPVAAPTAVAPTAAATTAVATPAADGKPALSDQDIAATIVAAPSSP